MAKTKTPEFTAEQIKELKQLAKAIESSEKVKELRSRFKGVVENYEEALREGIDVDGLHISLKVSRTLVAEEE